MKIKMRTERNKASGLEDLFVVMLEARMRSHKETLDHTKRTHNQAHTHKHTSSDAYRHIFI